MRTLNLGIVAHVDAGKTSLTERLLYDAGVIDTIGRVDHGSTRTDTLAVERERGITVKSAVVSFDVGDVTVNLIDTPGHPDFIGEVDRALGLLDAAVLVVSAVEGVQAQTRILSRALQRLRIPTLVFVNKIDRVGADPQAVGRAVRHRLATTCVRITDVHRAGERAATVGRRQTDDPQFVAELVEALADHDDEVVARFVEGNDLDGEQLWRRLVRATRRAEVRLLLAGSAMTGAGMRELVDALVALATRPPAASGPPSGVVFKIEHAQGGRRVPVVRMFAGTIGLRQRVDVGDGRSATVTRIEVLASGGSEDRPRVLGGQVARITGLGAVRIGDAVGAPRRGTATSFSPPLFDATVVPVRRADRRALRVALERLAAEDPLIDLRHDDVLDESTVSLYGEVQREIIADTLRRDAGIEVTFGPVTIVHIERVLGSGQAAEHHLTGRSASQPFLGAVGLRVEPAPPGEGVTFSPGIEPGRLPAAFIHATEEAVRHTLRHGLHGWDVPDARVTMTSSGYWPRQSRAHGTFDRNMSSVAADFRHLGSLVLVDALRQAGMRVHEPVHRFRLDAPAASVHALAGLLARTGADHDPPEMDGDDWLLVEGTVAVAQLGLLRRSLPSVTAGQGAVETIFAGYRPVRGESPERPHGGIDPRDRAAYLRQIAGRPR